MKKFLIIIFLFFYVYGFSQPASDEEIKTVALNFYYHLTGEKISDNEIIKQKNHLFKGVLTYSVIVFKNNDWVIISADKKADPILAFSEEKNYSDFIPPVVENWLIQYDYYVYSIKNNISVEYEGIDYPELWNDLLKNNLVKYKQPKEVIVSPLLSTKWGQSQSNTGNDAYAYNYYAPPGLNCEHTLAGCPATAAGQILKYWQYPDCNIFDWARMPNTLDFSSSNYQIYKKEIANLLRNLGDKMQIYMGASFDYYGCGGSGTNSVEAILFPLKDDFFYSAATIIDRSDYGLNAWKDVLCNELELNRPILYTGFDNYGGHAFICDGYEKPLIGKKFHFNFGWCGSHDGYYRIGNPYGYSYNQKAIIKIYPTIYCNSSLTVFQSDKYGWFSYFNFYNPKAGTIYSSPDPIVIANNDNVHYQAYNEIVLENFETEDGAEFLAEIIPCPLNCDFTNYKNEYKSNYSYSAVNNQESNNDFINQQYNNKIVIYPNPSNGIFTIYCNTENKNGKIEIYNCLGKLVFNKNIKTNGFKIDLLDNPNGIYILKYISSEFNYQQKIIKQ